MVFALVVHGPEIVYYESYYAPITTDMRILLSKEIAKHASNDSIENKGARDGVVRLRVGRSQKLATGAEFIVWKKRAGTFYSLLLEKDENVQTAEIVLNAIANGLPVTASESELFGAKLDEFIALIDYFLPAGMLYPFSQLQVKFMKKEVEQSIK